MLTAVPPKSAAEPSGTVPAPAPAAGTSAGRTDAAGPVLFTPKILLGKELDGAKARLHRMLGDAVRGSAWLLTRESFNGLVPRPRQASRWWQLGKRWAYRQQLRQYGQVQEQMRRAYAKLEELSAVSIKDFSRNAGSPASFELLQSTVEALYAMYGGLKSYGRNAGSSAGLAAFQMEILFLAQELTNCAAMAGGVTAGELRDAGLKDVKGAVSHYSPYMHGAAKMLDAVGAEAAELITELDRLEGQPEIFSPDQYAAALDKVGNGLKTLTQRIDSYTVTEKMYAEVTASGKTAQGKTSGRTAEGAASGRTAEGEVGEPHFVGNSGSYNKLKRYLEAGLQRAGELQHADIRGVLRTTLDGFLPPMPEEQIGSCALLPSGGPALRDFLNEANAVREELLARLENNRPEGMEKLLAGLLDQYTAEIRRTMEMLPVVYDLIGVHGLEPGLFRRLQEERAWHSKDPRYRELGAPDVRRNDYVRGLLHMVRTREEAEDLFDSLLRRLEENPVLSRDIPQLAALLEHSVFVGTRELGRVEFNRFIQMILARNEMNHLRGQYINKAFENSLSLPAILTAAALRIPPQYIALHLDDQNLLSLRSLGGGNINEKVQVCQYRDANGVEQKFVFKGEVPARRGMEIASAAVLGYAPEEQVMKLNVATSTVAAMLGTEDVVVSSRIGVLHGNLGLFMSFAEGESMRDILKGGIAARGKNGRNYTFKGLIAHFKAHGMFDKFRASLLKQYCKLEWQDLLAGQIDRHWHNYTFTCNPETAEVKLSGVDNDASFSLRLVGAGRVWLPRGVDSRIDTLRRSLEENRVPMRGDVVDMRSIPLKFCPLVQRVFGLNQTFHPRMIDRETYTKLMAVRTQEYHDALRPLLEKRELNAAVMRLQNLQQIARDLHDDGLVIDNWENPDLLRIELAQRIYSEEMPRIEYLNGFFIRDIYPFFGEAFYGPAGTAV